MYTKIRRFIVQPILTQVPLGISMWAMAALCFLTTPQPISAQTADGTPAPVPAAAASPLDGKIISELTIVGLETIDEAYVRNQIRTRAGVAYSLDQVQRDIGQLLRTGRFLDVQADPQLVDGQVALTLRIVEKPDVVSVEFVGNEEFKPKDLYEVLVFAAGDPLDLYDVRRGAEAIERLYKEKGYAYVEVTFDEELLRTERRVVYQIVENQRIRVRKVRFEGNITYASSELEREVETKTYIPIFRTGDFDPDRTERDAAKLQQYYRERGFLDAEVSYVPEFIDVAREKLAVIFRISEGIRYIVSEVRLQGNEVLTEDELLDLMLLKTGDFMVEMRLRTDVKNIETAYGSRGYIYAQVLPSRVFAAEPGQVVLTLSIHEGDQFRVGWIEVNGNARTQEKCVRREVRIYPEEIYDVTKTRDAERRLKATGLFNDANIQPIEPENKQLGVRDMLVNVEENTQTTNFILGVAASSDSGVGGNIVLENRNFDLFDTPRDLNEFIRGQAFRGAGQTFRISLNPGTEVTHFNIDFREPYLMDKPIGFGTNLHLFERGRDGYDENRLGGYVSFDKTFEDGFLAGWIGEIALRMDYIDVNDREAFAAKDIRDVDGGNFLSSVKLSLLHDTTDSRFTPSQGHQFRVSWEQTGVLGGDFTFGKLTSSYAKHWTVAIDDQDRKSIVTSYTRFGQIFGESPVFERFYAGGIGSMRGFDFRGISPRDGIRENRIGGDFMLLTGGEYTFPLYTEVIRGVFFADMGTVEEDFGINSWRAAVGVGVRMTLPIFGTVPMEFDFAIPVSKDSDDDTRIFSFFIGLPFM